MGVSGATEPSAKRRPLSARFLTHSAGAISKSYRWFHTKLPQIEPTLLRCWPP